MPPPKEDILPRVSNIFAFPIRAMLSEVQAREVRPGSTVNWDIGNLEIVAAVSMKVAAAASTGLDDRSLERDSLAARAGGDQDPHVAPAHEQCSCCDGCKRLYKGSQMFHVGGGNKAGDEDYMYKKLCMACFVWLHTKGSLYAVGDEPAGAAEGFSSQYEGGKKPDKSSTECAHADGCRSKNQVLIVGKKPEPAVRIVGRDTQDRDDHRHEPHVAGSGRRCSCEGRTTRPDKSGKLRRIDWRGNFKAGEPDCKLKEQAGHVLCHAACCVQSRTRGTPGRNDDEAELVMVESDLYFDSSAIKALQEASEAYLSAIRGMGGMAHLPSKLGADDENTFKGCEEMEVVDDDGSGGEDDEFDDDVEIVELIHDEVGEEEGHGVGESAFAGGNDEFTAAGQPMDAAFFADETLGEFAGRAPHDARTGPHVPQDAYGPRGGGDDKRRWRTANVKACSGEPETPESNGYDSGDGASRMAPNMSAADADAQSPVLGLRSEPRTPSTERKVGRESAFDTDGKKPSVGRFKLSSRRKN